MRYKVGDKVVLKRYVDVFGDGQTVRINYVDYKLGTYQSEQVVQGTFDISDIDHTKSAELNQSDPLIEKLDEVLKEKGVKLERSDTIKPKHYRKGEIDLYEAAYLTRPFNEYRAIMEFVAERYIKRDKDNRVEDIEKAIYTLERLKEKELLQ